MVCLLSPCSGPYDFAYEISWAWDL
jgi:hypothetical protein